MNFLTIINGLKTLAKNVDFIDFANGAFRSRLTGTATTDGAIALPNDSGTLLLDDRPVGSLNSGVSLRGYEPLVPVPGSKTLALTDAGTTQTIVGVATSVITIPLNSAVAFPVGTRIIVVKATTGNIAIAWGSGLTINIDGTLYTSSSNAAVYTSAVLRKTATDTWILSLPVADNLSQVRYLFVIAGESNAGGCAANSLLTADQLLIQGHAKIWHNVLTSFQSLQIGTNNLISHSGLTDNVTHGIERGLAREVLNTLQWSQACILKAGQGGSAIATWSVGNASNNLSTLTTRYNAALAALHVGGYVVRPVLIWFSGINDAVAGTNTTTFRNATQAHFAQIRSLMGANTPIFMPQIMPTNAAYTAINTEIAAIDAADSNMWALPTVNIPSNPSDPYHYTANGYLQIARAFVDSFRNNLGITSTLSIGQARTASSNPIVSLKRSTVQSIPSAVTTPIVFNTVEIDTDNIFNAASGTVVIASGAEGTYSVTGMCTVSAAQQVRAGIYVNGILRAQSPLVLAATDIVYSGDVTRTLRLNAGDVVSLYIHQTNTANAARDLYINAEFQACLQMTRIGL